MNGSNRPTIAAADLPNHVGDVFLVALARCRSGAHRRLREGDGGPSVHPCRSGRCRSDAVRRHDRPWLPHALAALRLWPTRALPKLKDLGDGRELRLQTGCASSIRFAPAAASGRASRSRRSRKSRRASGSSPTTSASRSKAREAGARRDMAHDADGGVGRTS